MFLPAGPLKHKLPALLGQGKLRQELSAVHHPTLPAFSVGMSPREVPEHQLGWKQHPAHYIFLIPPSHSPSCFGCQGPPAAPPPASESSRPVRDLPAKNKPHWGQEGGSKIPSVASLSPTLWRLGVWDHHREMFTCTVPQFPHLEQPLPQLGRKLWVKRLEEIIA